MWNNNAATNINGSNATTAAAPPATFSSHPFQYIQECLDPNSPNYRFRYFFYNVIPGGSIATAPNKPTLVSDRLWTQVINDNPDTGKLIPILANGFGDLTARRAWQEENQSAQKAKLAELETRISSLLTRQDLDVATQLQVIQKQQLKLTLQIIALMRKVETMRKTGVKISPQEQTLMARMQDLAQQLQNKPLMTGNVKHMETQLQSLIEANRLDPLADAKDCLLADGASVNILNSVLVKQKEGLTALIETLNKSSKDLEIMRNGFSI